MSTIAPECLTRPSSNEGLSFNNKFLGPILAGDKTQTLRINQKPIDKYSTIKATFNESDMVLRLFILNRGGKFYKDLTVGDAYREGYNNVDALRRELREIYPDIHRYTPLYYYRFKVVG